MRITFAIGSRANFASVRSVIERLRAEHEVRCLCYGTSTLELYGNVSKQIEAICPVARLSTHIAGGTPESASLSAALAGQLATVHLAAEPPDLVYVVGDRYEVGPVAYAAHVLGIKLAHQMAGEVSGTIDDKIRHCITQLADYHFCATEKSAQRVQDMIGGPGRVYVTGCPRIDVAKRVKDRLAMEHTVGTVNREVYVTQADLDQAFGFACGIDSPPAWLDVPKPYIVVMFHPDCDVWQQAGDQMRAVLDGVDAAWDGDVHLFWPNSDPGCEAIVQAVRDRKRPRQIIDNSTDANCPKNIRYDLSRSAYFTHRSLPDEAYYALLAGARCAVGNSSSFLREGAYLATPVVLVGNRQQGRELAKNVRFQIQDVSAHEIREAVRHCIAGERCQPSELYGDGRAAEKIAEVIRG